MKRFCLHCFIAGVFTAFSFLTGNVVLAQDKGPPAEVIKGAYRQILSSTDKDADGKLSLAECMSISSNKSKIEKDCKYWDANGDGSITEEEYVQQVKGLMR